MQNGRDWHSIEKLYVFGEITGTRPDGTCTRWYPSIRELAARFGVARSVVGNRARRGNWLALRDRFQATEREFVWRDLIAEELRRDA